MIGKSTRVGYGVRWIARAKKTAPRVNMPRRLSKGLREPRARLLAIRDDVLRTIRPAGPSFLDLPLEALSAPDRTLADQYGHPADRALLLAAMLDAAGFDPEFLLASQDTTRHAPYAAPSRDVPQRGYYHHLVVAVTCEGQHFILNEGDQYDRAGRVGTGRRAGSDAQRTHADD